METNRVICGDCREIMNQWDDGCIDMVITSPPYWKSRLYNLFNSKEIGYYQTYKAYLSSLNYVWIECCRLLRKGGKIVINIGEILFRQTTKDLVTYTHIFTDICNQFNTISAMQFWGKVFWCKGRKNHAGMIRGKSIYGSYPYPPNIMLTNSMENLLVFRKRGASKVVLKEIREKSKIDKKFISEFTKPIWFIPPQSEKRKAALKGHPAVFPKEIPLRFIKAYTFIDDIVLDPFGGIGTTGLTAQKLGRRYILIDLSPEYVEMAKRNLSQGWLV